MDKTGERLSLGLHLTIDAACCEYSLLNNDKFLYQLLNELPDKIGMTRIGQPVLTKFPPRSGKDCGGYTGFVILTESHISLHTFPEKNFLSMDVYSCRTFNPEAIIQEIKSIFNTNDVITHTITRGENFPQY